MWTRLLRAIRGKSNPVGSLIVQGRVGQPQWSERNLSAFAKEGYRLNPYVFRAVDLRAKAIGGLRWIAVRRKRNGNIDELDGHPLAALIRRPQPRKGGARFLYEVEAQLCIGGNSFVTGAGPTSGANAGKPRELWTLRNDLVHPVAGTGPTMPVAGYEYQAENGGIKRFKPEEVLHLSYYHPQSEFYGMSPLEPGGRSVDHNNAARAWNVALLQNSAQPTGAFVSRQGYTEQMRRDLNAQFLEERAGPLNAGLPLMLEGEVDWRQMGLSPKDMDWLEGSRLSSREISTVYGVPPEMLGDAPSKAYASYVEARKAFYQDTVIPEADALRDDFNIFLEAYDAELDYDRDAIEALREDRQKLFVYMTAAYQSAIITKNEARAALGYDDDPDGDVYIDDGFGEIPDELPDLDADKPDDEGETEPEPDEDEADDEEEPDGLKGLRMSKAGQRILLYKSIDRRRTRWIRTIARSAGKRLTAQRIAIVNAIESATDPIRAADEAILDQYDAWGKFYKSLYLTVGADFGRATISRLKASAGPSYTKAAGDTERLTEELVEEYIRRHSGTKIQGILDTDLERVRAELVEGVRAGESAQKLADRIDQYLEPIYERRAQTVARTEVVSASSLGSQMAAKATGLPIKKSYLATPGTRTRETHLAADGQTVEIDQPYVVGGSKLMFPGDPSLGAPAEETINCRCSETYEAQEADA